MMLMMMNATKVSILLIGFTQVELFPFIHFMCVAANASEWVQTVHLVNIELFLYHSKLLF